MRNAPLQTEDLIAQWRRARTPVNLVLRYALLVVVVVAILLGSVTTMEGLDAQIKLGDAVELDTSRLLELQVDEETGIRGYDATGIQPLLQPFAFAQDPLAKLVDSLRARVAGNANSREAIDDFSSLHDAWLRNVAWPIVRDPDDPQNTKREELSKRLIDSMRSDIDVVQTDLDAEQQRLRRIRSSIRFLGTAVLFLAVSAIGVIAYVSNRRSLAREEALLQMIVDERDAEARRSEWRTKIIAMLAHDFRSSLAVIRGYADLLESFPQKRDDAQSYEAIRKSVSDLTTMSEEALLMARVSNDALTIQLRPQPLGEILSEAASRYRDEREITIEHCADFVMGDRAYLLRVFDNLLSNAVKYSPATAPIRIAAARRGENDVEVTVTDRGEGIDQADLPHVFDEFWRASGTSERSGSGIGLFIVRKIVEAHGGTVRIESSRGGGTSVHVLLPAAAAPLVTAG